MNRIWTLAIIPLLASLSMAQEKKGQDKPLTQVVNDEKGVVVFKPKAEEWEIKKDADGHAFQAAIASVNHRIETFSIDLVVSTKTDQQKFFDKIDELSDKTKDGYEKDKDSKPIPDRKVERRVNEARKFPGAGGPNGWYAEFVIKDKGEIRATVRRWFFIDRQNPNNLIQIGIFGTDELAKKFDKDVQWVLGNIKTAKVKSK